MQISHSVAQIVIKAKNSWERRRLLVPKEEKATQEAQDQLTLAEMIKGNLKNTDHDQVAEQDKMKEDRETDMIREMTT